MGNNNGVPVSNKTWRKTHLFEGEYITKKVNVPRILFTEKRDIFKNVVVDKNNHKVELVIINGTPYRR